MGIKIVCPNGHKLNVKSFLAGKRGVCPQCGSKFDIPADAKEESPPADALAGVASSSVASGAGPATVVPAPAQPVVAPVQPVADQGAYAPRSPADPLAEAPEASWYVRPPSGGQYGPAKPQTMRQWIDEGRVTPDSLVWREGWPDWKIASETFPNLAGPGASGPGPTSPGKETDTSAPSALVPTTAAQPAKASAAPLLNIVTEDAPVRSGSRRHGRRDKTSARLTALVILFAILIVLSVVLVWVLN
jgi:hypothetical protein